MKLRFSTAIMLFLLVTVLAQFGFATPRIISFQGLLTDSLGVPIPDGPVSVRFIIWNDSIGAVPSNEIWNSGALTVTSTNGMVSVLLGAVPQPSLTSAAFSDTLRWLGITVGADPEIDPRSRIATVPYAFIADSARVARALVTDSGIYTSESFVRVVGDTMTGDLAWDKDGSGRDVRIQTLDSLGGRLTLSNDDSMAVALRTDSLGGSLGLYRKKSANRIVFLSVGAADSIGGVLNLNRQDGNSGVIMSGGTQGLGSALSMYNRLGTNTISFDAGVAGNGAVNLPDNSISSSESMNEPGIAAYDDNSIVELHSSVMQNIASVTITIPASGYIVVQAKVNAALSGTRSSNFGYVQIDESGGGTTTAPYYAAFGLDSSLTAESYSMPVYVHRIFAKSAGTYTFQLEGMAYPFNGAGALTRCIYPMIMATYCPSSYGAVSAMVSAAESGAFKSALPRVANVSGTLDPAGPQTLYQVDLRELELKAAKEQAEAEKAQRELLEARMRQLIEGTNRE